MVKQFTSVKSSTIDVVQCLLITAIVVGCIIKFQNGMNKHAFDRIQKANESLKDSELKAENANHAKSDFLSNMSHEIRTPINAILGMNEMILRECKDKNILEYASAVQTSSNALLSLVNDVLDLSKIESGKLEIKEEEYKLLLPLAAKMFIENTKRQLRYLKPDVFANATDEDFYQNFYEPLRSGRVPGEVLDFQIIYPLSLEEEKKEWKKSRLEAVKEFMLKQIQEEKR